MAQWWIVAAATVPLLPAAVYLTFRSGKAALLSLAAPAVPAAISCAGQSIAPDHAQRDGLVIFSVATVALAVLIASVRGDVRKAEETARREGTSEAPADAVKAAKRKGVAYGPAAVVLGGAAVLLLL